MQASAQGRIPLYRFDSMTPYGALVAGCTGRRGGVSKPPYDTLNLGLHVGDDPEDVLENRRRLATALGVELASFVIPQQVHGGGVRAVAAADRGRGALTAADAVPDTDALITREAGLVLGVLVADCVPLVVFDPETPAVGVAHAGWNGTVRHIARNTVEAMRTEFGSNPARLLAGIGPSIGPTSYEVGDDVAEQGEAEFPGAGVIRRRGDEKFLFDLRAANVADLSAAGLPREAIEVAGLDTLQLSAELFSHRHRQPTGRFLAFAMLSGIVSPRGRARP